MSTPYLDGLLRNLHTETPASRVEALRRLRAGRTPQPPYDDAAVQRLLHDPEPLTRIIAAERMARRGADRVVPALVDLLGDQRGDVRACAAAAAAVLLRPALVPDRGRGI